MMLRQPVGGKAAVEPAREAALRVAALCRCPVSCTEACRAASAQQGFSRALVPRTRPIGRARTKFTPGQWHGGFSRLLQQQLIECLCWSLPCEGLAWAAVELGGDGVEAGAVVAAQIGAFGEVLAKQRGTVFSGWPRSEPVTSARPAGPGPRPAARGRPRAWWPSAGPGAPPSRLAATARYPWLTRLPASSRLTVEAARQSWRAISRTASPAAAPAAVSSRSARLRNRPEGGTGRRGRTPPRCWIHAPLPSRSPQQPAPPKKPAARPDVPATSPHAPRPPPASGRSAADGGRCGRRPKRVSDRRHLICPGVGP